MTVLTFEQLTFFHLLGIPLVAKETALVHQHV